MEQLSCMVLVLAAVAAVAGAATPVVLWHGMGDTCCNPISMGSIKRSVEKEIPGIYVYSIEVGGSVIADEFAGFFGNFNNQLKEVCAKLAADPKLAGGFNAMGFSQGGQFLRAYVERCNNPPVKNLITFGGQHLGVTDIPHCPIDNTTSKGLCNEMVKLLGEGAYLPGVREVSIQAQYFRTTLNYKDYVDNNIFLADINNERAQKNSTYVKNLVSLKNFVMVQFDTDTMVEPRESELFGSYAMGSLKEIVPMRQQPIYTEDWIGLKQLDQAGKLIEKHLPGDHLQIPESDLKKYIETYLKD